jgi:hypothetical protein
MAKRLKYLCNRRKYIIILGTLVVLGAAWIIWLLYDFVYSSNHIELPLEQRTAFVSLWVAIVGFSLAVAGTVIAVLQFQASQRKPDLHLWLEEVGQESVTLVSEQQSVRFILQNQRNRVARYVKCTLRFFIPHHVPLPHSSFMIKYMEILPAPSEYSIEHWSQVTRKQDSVDPNLSS